MTWFCHLPSLDSCVGLPVRRLRPVLPQCNAAEASRGYLGETRGYVVYVEVFPHRPRKLFSLTTFKLSVHAVCYRRFQVVALCSCFLGAGVFELVNRSSEQRFVLRRNACFDEQAIHLPRGRRSRTGEGTTGNDTPTIAGSSLGVLCPKRQSWSRPRRCNYTFPWPKPKPML